MNWNGYEGRDLLGAYYDCEKPSDSDIYSGFKKICPFPFYSCVINCDGTVTACCVDWNKNTIIGDLRTESFEDIWNGKKAYDLRLRLLDGPCRDCQFLHTAADNIDELSHDDFKKKYMANRMD
jgi:radical SAM protein with 4Fe4S-binding SPASM domain